jgi:hypothetical protein
MFPLDKRQSFTPIKPTDKIVVEIYIQRLKIGRVGRKN